MRFVIALLAVMALLASPVTAAAAQAACGNGASAASGGMDMPVKAGTTHAAASTAAADPCCDHSTDQHKMSDKSCAQACAASCVATAALLTSFTSTNFVFTRAPMSPPRLAPALSYQPFGLERPPKSMV